MSIFYSATQSATYQRHRKKHNQSMRKSKRKSEFKPMEVQTNLVIRDGADHSQIPSKELHSFGDVGTRKESPKYTGTYVKGISTMHKSNAVPIVSEEQAKEHSQMRRN